MGQRERVLANKCHPRADGVRRDALTQSLCSPDSTMTTGESLDARRVAIPGYIPMRDGIGSQHGMFGNTFAAEDGDTSTVVVYTIP